ncbi:large conductance mechanosensitive channel protein MscL [Brachyspira pilosicoli]|uniref:large conductance mechanosensitive channel protein MscL n=1 Tax=Brachyspira pilosicoli TaxID=52584 RepID=UPI001CA5DE7A|nr:large conductance mechanosensitive channel protein MscL [Brachyspira pilosicoli]MBW5397107.1 large conductance mechanosensitive channel protein MscL [Brachyspira pilosicoli]
MLKEFKNFIMRGNVIDMSIGIIIGSAFSKIVNSFVEDILMPPIGLMLSGIDFSNIFIVIKKGIENQGPYTSLEIAKNAGAVVISVGMFFNAIISFIITAISIFIIIKATNKIQEKMTKEKKEDKKEIKVCPYCYSNINIKAIKCPNCTSDLN